MRAAGIAARSVRRTRVACLVLVGVALLASTRPAAAHQTSVKYVDLIAREHTVDVTIKVAPGDVTDPMGLPADATPSVADALSHPRVAGFVQHWIVLVGCTAGDPAIRADGASFLAVSWTATCPTPRALSLDFKAFFAVDKRHEAIVRLSAQGSRPVQTIVRSASPALTLRAGESPSLLAWVRTGMDHIYSGVDHMLFVVSLLLVVMLAPAGGQRRGWQLRAFVPMLRSTAVVITAFTLAHSLTLITAALGLVSLPSQLVESLIALSIAYTAAEDVVNPAVRWRFALTFGFGLIHGLGFASTLQELLPPSDVIVPLLCFNVGVEIGQLSILVVVLPALYGLAWLVGADRYRRIVLPLLAAPIFLVGIAMVIERVASVRLLPM
jgi:hypothetical protein